MGMKLMVDGKCIEGGNNLKTALSRAPTGTRTAIRGDTLIATIVTHCPIKEGETCSMTPLSA